MLLSNTLSVALLTDDMLRDAALCQACGKQKPDLTSRDIHTDTLWAPGPCCACTLAYNELDSAAQRHYPRS